MMCDVNPTKIFLRAFLEVSSQAEGVSLNEIVTFYVRLIHEILCILPCMAEGRGPHVILLASHTHVV
jgi:hypothetical protein